MIKYSKAQLEAFQQEYAPWRYPDGYIPMCAGCFHIVKPEDRIPNMIVRACGYGTLYYTHGPICYTVALTIRHWFFEYVEGMAKPLPLLPKSTLIVLGGFNGEA